MDKPQTYHILIVFLVVPKLTRMYTKNDGLEHVHSWLPEMAIYGTQICKTHALMRAMKKPGCLGYIGDEILRSYVGSTINH